jgi:hypothetical protein
MNWTVTSFFYHCKRTYEWHHWGRQVLLIEEDKDWSLLHDLTLNCYAFIGICGSRPPPFGSLSRIHSTRMHVSFSIASANMSAVLSIHIGSSAALSSAHHGLSSCLAVRFCIFFVIFVRLGTLPSLFFVELLMERFWTLFSCRARDHFPICAWREQNTGKWMWKCTYCAP